MFLNETTQKLQLRLLQQSHVKEMFGRHTKLYQHLAKVADKTEEKQNYLGHQTIFVVMIFQSRPFSNCQSPSGQWIYHDLIRHFSMLSLFLSILNVSFFVSISPLTSSHFLPASYPLGLYRSEFWTRVDLAVIDYPCVHPSFAGYLSPPRSQEREGEKEEWSGVRGGRMDLLMRGSGSGRCIRVWMVVDDEAFWCQGQLHSSWGPKIYPFSCLIYAKHSLELSLYHSRFSKRLLKNDVNVS